MVNAVPGHKSPVGASVYGSIAGDAWYRAQYLLQDQKLGHYMHIPPKTVFFSQIFGSLVGVPINYAVVRWVLDNKMGYLDGTVIDPNHQWTGQSLASSLTAGVQYVVVVYPPPSSSHFTYQQCAGSPRALPPTNLPPPPLRLPPRRRRSHYPIPPRTTLSQRTIPPLEHHNLLLRPLQFLRQYQHWLPLFYHRWVCGYVLGLSPPL